MRRKKLIMIIVVAGLAYMVASMMGGGKKKPAPEEPKPARVEPQAPVTTTKVVVAKTNIPARVKITSDMVELADVEKEEVVEDGLRSISGVIGKATKEGHLKGEQLHKKRLHEYEGKAGLALSIPEDYRALTIKIDEVSGVGGFIQQGDYVDVIAIYGDRALDEPFAKTISQNAQVLTIGKTIRVVPESVQKELDAAEGDKDAAGKPKTKAPAPAPAGKKPAASKAAARKKGSAPEEELDENMVAASTANIVTIAVSLHDAEKISVAESKATLRLVLRSPFNEEVTWTKGALSSDVSGRHKSRELLTTEKDRHALNKMIIEGGPVEIFHGADKFEGGSK